MNVPTRPVRTYSRRQSTKNILGSGSPSPERNGKVSSSRLNADEEPPRKRRTLLDNGDLTSGLEGHSAVSKTSSHSSKPGSREVPTVLSSPTQETGPVTDRLHVDNSRGKASNSGVDNISDFPTKYRDTSPSVSETSVSYPSTPRKPKDLSRIFEFVSPQRKTQSPSNSPGKSGITKKMLSRAKTESSIESSPTKETSPLPIKAQSFIIPRKPDVSSQEDSTPSASPRRQLSRNSSLNSIAPGGQHPQRAITSSTRTYAGNSRSFLVALPAASLLNRNNKLGIGGNTLDEDDEDFLRDSYAELRKRYGVDDSESIDGESAGSAPVGEGLALYNPLSSITDLRSKGESRRFRDEVGYLFEGLESNGSLGVRRSAAFDIISKLCDQEFWKKSRAAGLLVDIWDRLREAGAGNGDKILDPLLCCFVALASEDSRDVSLLATKEDFVETTIRLMITHAANDPLSPNSSNGQLKLSKIEIQTLSRLRDLMVMKTNVVKEACQPSTRLLVSSSLSSLPSLAFPHLTVVLNSVSGDLAGVCTRLAAYKSGLPLFTEAIFSVASHEKLCFNHMSNCLLILDSYLIEMAAFGDMPNLTKADLRRQFRTLPSGLVALIAVADIINDDDKQQPEAFRSQAKRCSELAFRILINLTNEDPIWTDAVVADPYTLPTIIRLVMAAHRRLLGFNANKLAVDETERNESASVMDRLCLALALLTNLLQERDNLSYSLHNTMLDPACKGQRTCLLGCRCANSVSAITGLVNMYISFLKDEDDELAPDFHFLRGHLAVLIGLILLQLPKPSFSSASNTPTSSPFPSQSSSPSFPTLPTVDKIIDALPGPLDASGRWRKLDALIDNVDEFSRLYASLANRTRQNSVSDPTNMGEEQEQRDIPEGGSDVGRNGHGSDVVTGVADSLRKLRHDLCGL